MELEDLLGTHKLDAVDFHTVETEDSWGGDANVCRFRLDGTVYEVTEDPSDGYRSHMKDITVSKDTEMKNVFQEVTVVGAMKPSNSYYTDNILLLIDATTGKTILEVGTSNSDDYYPSFVASFSPENMVTNQGAG